MRIVIGIVLALFGLYATFEYSDLWKNERTKFFSSFGKIEEQKAQCEKGKSDYCYNAGFQLANGIGVDKDEEEAVVFYKKSCELNSPIGCLEFGKMLADGNGVKKSTKKAEGVFKKGCDLGNGDACALWGITLKELDAKKNENQAFELFMNACEKQKSGAGCYALGQTLEARKNFKEAIKYYNRGCDNGAPVACLRIAEIYGDGVIVERDYSKAIDYLKEACDYDLDQACYMAFEMEKGLTGVYHHTFRYEMKVGCNKGEFLSCAGLKVIDFFK